MKRPTSRFVMLLVLFSLLVSLPTLESQENPTACTRLYGIQYLYEDFQSHQCRFWGMIAGSLPEGVVLDHLINLPYSLKNLGANNRDGWGLAYYNDIEPIVSRGEPPANIDPNFVLAAQELARSGACIGVGHVRAAASGASDIPNPHPFIRYKGGRWWAFGHNGVLSKTTLKNLIGPDYLAENPPTVGDNWEDPDVIDSDLYMLYILKCIEEKDWNFNHGIAKAVTDIREVDPGAMNFFLTDGETLWGFRKGTTLYYYYNETFPQYSAIASQPPTGSQVGWTALYDYNLIILTIDQPPYIIDDITTIPEFPVGGHAVPIESPTIAKPLIPYIILLAILAGALAFAKRKTPEKRINPSFFSNHFLSQNR